jgi:hypothetical protein
MTDKATTNGEPPRGISNDEDEDTDVPERDEIMDLLEDGIQEAHRKVTSGRVRDPEKEKVRQGWHRTLGYLAGQYRQLKKDEDIEELEKELELIKEATGVNDE